MGVTFTFDIETAGAEERWSRGPDFVRLCGFAIDDGEPQITRSTDLLIRGLRNSDLVVGHNIMSYDLPVLDRYAAPPGLLHELAREERVVDTKLTAFLNDPPTERMKAGQVEKAYSLQNLTGAKVGDLKALAKLHGDYDQIPLDDPEFREYLLGDVRAARQLHHQLQVTPYVRREHKVAAIAAQISMNGFRVDVPLLEERLAEGARIKAEGIEKLTRVYGLPTTKKDGKPVTSPQATEAGKHAIAEAFRAAKINLPRTDSGAPALGQDVMDAIIEKAKNPESVLLAELVKSLNGVRTVYQTVQDYLVGDRVHPDIAMRQVSGRWSITKPGLTVMGKRAGRYHEREVFLPEPGEVIISVDLDQVDARAIAAHSQDPAYMALFDPGRDLHTEVALAVWGDASRREDAKVVGHGWNYGMGARGISRNFPAIPLVDAERFDISMTERFPRLVQWRTKVRERAETGEFLDNGFGRPMRPNPDRAWTQGPALMGQGTARDILMEGLLRLPPELLPMLRAVVHDEVVLSVPEADAEEIQREVVRALSFEWCPPHGLRPISITAGLAGPAAPSWGEVYAK